MVIRDYQEDYPDGLPEPELTQQPLYACAHCTSSQGHLVGSHLAVFSVEDGAESRLGEGPAAWPIQHVPVTLAEGQSVSTRYSICDDVSPASQIVEVQPEPIPESTRTSFIAGQL